MATKTYKKFLTGAATAAMVASAVAPVAAQGQDVADKADNSFSDIGPSSSHYVNVMEARELGFLSGYPDGKFQPNKKLNRGDVTKMLGKYVVASSGMSLNEYVEEHKIADVPNFTDVPDDARDQELVTYSKIVKDAGIFQGSNNNLMATKLMPRDQIAAVLVRAFDLKDDTSVDTEVEDGANSGYVKEIEILLENEVSNANPYRPSETTSRAQFASFLVRAYKVSEGWDPGEVLPEIEAVNKLDDITIKVGQSPSLPATVGITYDNGSTGTAAVEWDTSKLDNNKEGTYKLTGDVAGTDLEATVNVIVEADELGEVTEAEITTGVIDDDMDKQFIEFTVNGKTVSVEELVNVHGYEVEFQANKAVFVEGTTSKFGEIDEGAVKINDSFSVKVVLTKDGKVVKSASAAVQVVNLNATPEIGGLALVNNNGTADQKDDFRMSSSTLVVSETATVAGIVSKTGDVIAISGTPVFTTSNPAIATVDPKTGAIRAIAPGKVTITATAGNQSYSVTLEVTNTERELSSVTSIPTTLNLAPGATGTVFATVADQYGDPIEIKDASILEATSEGIHAGQVTQGSTIGKATVAVKADAKAAAGDYTVYFRDAQDENLLGTIAVNVSTANTADASKTVLETAVPTATSNLVIGGSPLILNINQYTVDGGFVGLAAGGYTVTSADTDIATVETKNGVVTVTPGTKTGPVDIVLTNNKGTVVHTFRVNVTASPVFITDVDWKEAPTVITAGQAVGIENVLTVVKVDGDDIVEGVGLNVDTTSYVRIKEDGKELYLDVDDNGSFGGKDHNLGKLAVEADPASNFTVQGTLRPAHTTASGNVGTLIFTLSDYATDDVLGSTTLNVNVK